MARITEHPNVLALLDTIAFTEGTDNIAPVAGVTPGRPQVTHDEGYDVLVGGKLFSDYSVHPLAEPVALSNGIRSTAAGRYQILHKFWLSYQARLHWPDFGPNSQDAYAVQQLRERNLLDPMRAGQFEKVIAGIANVWASLPGAGYGQHEFSLDDVRRVYIAKGGLFDGGP